MAEAGKAADVPGRYTAAPPFPPYTYVPGRSPHPKSDPAGHAYGRAEPRPPAIDEANWSQSIDYHYAVDLFNHGYYWEAHETWEALWHACGRSGPTADLLKGLIKLAAAGVKVREGRPTGAASHARRAAELFRAATADAVQTRLGLNLDGLVTLAESIAAAPPTPPPDVQQASAAAFPVFAFRIEPQFPVASERAKP